MTDVQPIAALAQQALAAKTVAPGGIYLVATADGRVDTIDLSGPEYTGQLDRKVGTTTVRDATSFLAYYAKHHDANTEVYSDVEKLSITAVLDAHTGTDPRFGAHRLHLALRRTKAWEEWTSLDGKLVSQDTFANFLEDHLPSLVEPDAATMLEIAQSIKATTKAEFQSSSRLQSGERKFAFVEDTKASAGTKGDLAIPETFRIAVPPFEGADAYSMVARFKYRLDRGQLALGFKLEQPEERARAAFADVLAAISAEIDTPILNGTPA
ncbi:DUF2303 family protein [Streptomyces scabiei]|uniref:DUF2303 family protein n=1 Tax=Streptomyces scabiei TaxID=1930 RepID=UPI0029BE7376|nr:DUF2303 family protein [Streptomyces scabiei]MDX3035361.1 DUF2303 family protein [Streptomyces scabiei]